MGKLLSFITIFSLFISSLYAHEQFNKMQLDYVKEHNPKLLKVYNKIKKESKESNYHFFLLGSSSMPTHLFKVYTASSSNYWGSGIKGGIFLNGFTKKTFAKIQDSAKKIQKIKGFNDSSYGTFKFDPDYFLENNITKVPVLLLSLCKGNKMFPSDCETVYSISGTTNVGFFVEQIRANSDDYDFLN